MKVVLIGATGATGKDLLDLLIQDDDITSIDIFVRSNINFQHSKLNVHIIDFNKPGEWKHLVKGDILFSCLGTTLKAAGSKEEQYKVDYHYQYQFANAASENNVDCYVLVSSGFASSKSSLFYSRMKGQLEDDVNALNFPKLIIFKPPILIRKGSKRKGEIFGIKVIEFLNTFGILKSNKPMSTKLLAGAMINAVKKLPKGKHTLQLQEILKF